MPITLSEGNVTANFFIGDGSQITGTITPMIAFSSNSSTTVSATGKCYYKSTNGDLTLTIANAASQNFNIGSSIQIMNQGTGNITVAQGTGVTLYLSGNASSGNRTVTTFGAAALLKVASDTWIITGTAV